MSIPPVPTVANRSVGAGLGWGHVDPARCALFGPRENVRDTQVRPQQGSRTGGRRLRGDGGRAPDHRASEVRDDARMGSPLFGALVVGGHRVCRPATPSLQDHADVGNRRERLRQVPEQPGVLERNHDHPTRPRFRRPVVGQLAPSLAASSGRVNGCSLAFVTRPVKQSPQRASPASASVRDPHATRSDDHERQRVNQLFIARRFPNRVEKL